jgi:hypothetical protein
VRTSNLTLSQAMFWMEGNSGKLRLYQSAVWVYVNFILCFSYRHAPLKYAAYSLSTFKLSSFLKNVSFQKHNVEQNYMNSNEWMFLPVISVKFLFIIYVYFHAEQFPFKRDSVT